MEDDAHATPGGEDGYAGIGVYHPLGDQAFQVRFDSGGRVVATHSGMDEIQKTLIRHGAFAGIVKGEGGDAAAVQRSIRAEQAGGGA